MLKVTVSIGLNGQPRRDEYQCIIPSKKSVVEQDRDTRTLSYESMTGSRVMDYKKGNPEEGERELFTSYRFLAYIKTLLVGYTIRSNI